MLIVVQLYSCSDPALLACRSSDLARRALLLARRVRTARAPIVRHSTVIAALPRRPALAARAPSARRRHTACEPLEQRQNQAQRNCDRCRAVHKQRHRSEICRCSVCADCITPTICALCVACVALSRGLALEAAGAHGACGRRRVHLHGLRRLAVVLLRPLRLDRHRHLWLPRVAEGELVWRALRDVVCLGHVVASGNGCLWRGGQPGALTPARAPAMH